jgi:4a-hydroxytetrahydrobiopterin dehydratase
MEIDAGGLLLRPIGRDVARAVLDGRAPDDVVLAPGYPSRFSLEVLEMVAGVRPGGAGGFGPWFMVRKTDGAVVGEIGAGLDGGTAQVGYMVVEPSWGQGYATEALRALLAHLLADPRVDRVRADTLVGHAASRRVMEKAGMRLLGQRTGEVDGEPAELVVYEAAAGDPATGGPDPVPDRTLGRQEASDAVGGLGWRYVLGTLRTTLPVGSLAEATAVAARLVAACGDDADGSLSVDVRPDRLLLALQSRAAASVTAREVELARRIAEAAGDLGLVPDPGLGVRSVQLVEIAIDALDIPAVRPFWKAVLGYTDEPGRSGPEDPLVDPLGQGPAVWFQQMDAPRPQRNRIHLDVSLPHDEARSRLQATLAAGGVLVSDAAAPAFWVLADPEGNEACITTWQGRDPPPGG